MVSVVRDLQTVTYSDVLESRGDNTFQYLILKKPKTGLYLEDRATVVVLEGGLELAGEIDFTYKENATPTSNDIRAATILARKPTGGYNMEFISGNDTIPQDCFRFGAYGGTETLFGFRMEEDYPNASIVDNTNTYIINYRSLGPNIKSSSLETVGPLESLTVSGDINCMGNINYNGALLGVMHSHLQYQLSKILDVEMNLISDSGVVTIVSLDIPVGLWDIAGYVDCDTSGVFCSLGRFPDTDPIGDGCDLGPPVFTFETKSNHSTEIHKVVNIRKPATFYLRINPGTSSCTVSANSTGIIASQMSLTIVGIIDSLNCTGTVTAGTVDATTYLNLPETTLPADISCTSLTATGSVQGNALVGTIWDASQPNITEVGGLSGLTVNGNAGVTGTLTANTVSATTYVGLPSSSVTTPLTFSSTNQPTTGQQGYAVYAGLASNVSVPINTATTIMSITLGPGTWIVTGYCGTDNYTHVWGIGGNNSFNPNDGNVFYTGLPQVAVKCLTGYRDTISSYFYLGSTTTIYMRWYCPAATVTVWAGGGNGTAMTAYRIS